MALIGFLCVPLDFPIIQQVGPFQVFSVWLIEIQPWMEHGWHMRCAALVAPVDMMRFPAPPLPPLDRECLSCQLLGEDTSETHPAIVGQSTSLERDAIRNYTPYLKKRMQVEEAKGREKRKNQRNTIGTRTYVVLQKTDVLPKWDRKPLYHLQAGLSDLYILLQMTCRGIPTSLPEHVLEERILKFAVFFSSFLVWVFSQCLGDACVKCVFLFADFLSSSTLCCIFIWGRFHGASLVEIKHNTPIPTRAWLAIFSNANLWILQWSKMMFS